MSDASNAPGRGRWHLRSWEIVVIGIAVVLFILAAFAGPRGRPQTPLALPSTGATPTPAPRAGASESEPVPVPAPTGSPVATIEQILAEEVGRYSLVDRGLSEAGAQGGALQSAELRYSLTPADPQTDMFHAIEIHASADAARERVETFAEALTRGGYRRAREQPLRNAGGDVQGHFIALRGQGLRLLLWSNRNVTFSLGGGAEADVDAFYDLLPY